MTTHTLGTITANALTALTNWNTSGISTTDVGAMADTMISDAAISASNVRGGYSFGATASVCTGTTQNASGQLINVTQISTTVGVPVSQINVGDLVIGRGIPIGTFVTVSPGTTSNLTISQNATTSSAGTGLVFVRLGVVIDGGFAGGDLSPAGNFSQGILAVPGRGILKVMPGDIVAVDNTGWPILLSGATVSYGASVWSIV